MKKQSPSSDGGERVVISDLGGLPGPAEPSEISPPLPSPASPRAGRSGRVLTLGLLLAVVLLVVGDSRVGPEVQAADQAWLEQCAINPAGERASVADQLAIREQLRLFAAGTIRSGPDIGSSSTSTLLTSVDEASSELVSLARVNPDGLWEFCAASATPDLPDSPYSTMSQLGELPYGMSYVYRLEERTMTYSVAGIRLRDGSIVDTLTLPDGEIRPIPTPAG
jgi:hypothetical protein